MIVIGFFLGFLAACGMFAGWKLACAYYVEVGK